MTVTSIDTNENLQIPEPKWPPNFDSQWAPYGSEEEYFAQLAKFPVESPIGRAILLIEGKLDGDGPVAKAFELMTKAKDEFDAADKENYLRDARRSLMEALAPSTDNATFTVVDAAMPGEVEEANRQDDEATLSDNRAVWRFRLLYNLIVGVHKQALSSSNWQVESAAV